MDKKDLENLQAASADIDSNYNLLELAEAMMDHAAEILEDYDLHVALINAINNNESDTKRT